MKLDTRDPNYDRRYRYRCFIDEVEVQGVVALDTEQGWADIHERDAAGRLVIDRQHNCVRTKRYYGMVRVEKIAP